MTRLFYVFIGTCVTFFACLLLLKSKHTSAPSKRDVLVSYASSCFGLFPPNSIDLRRDERETPITVVIAAVSSDDPATLRSESGLRNGDSQIIHVADQPSPQNGQSQNKGNEAMAYLTYLIDHYDDLPDVMIFMHGHRTTWHNNALLSRSSPLTVNKLRPQAVLQRGFVNLACDKALRRAVEPVPGATGPSVLDLTREEWEAEDGGQKLSSQSPKDLHEQYSALWRELFPLQHHPDPPSRWDFLAGGQFALSRKLVESISQDRLRSLRDWILHTALSSRSAGAVFETLWEAIFREGDVGNATSFMTPMECYCDLYGLCLREERLPVERVETLLDAATLMMGHLLDS
ncbi:hypothetical protein B0T10DRAFT_601997 [Thelonectria olida]|uniref:Uncharacterized protein n=1 Tax=Thelonectria olida TaxID=1576542 RepID=A0A9P9AUB6_9HYPO|nr:hypothetical protein B0T10DRAFT_601997 [Thelonectria olida]